MVNRPLCIVLVLFVVGICLWHTFSHNETFASEEKTMTLEAEVETIKGGAKKQSLVVRNVVSDGRVFCDKLVAYQDKEADLFAALKLGNTIRVIGDFLPLEPAGNEGQFDEVTYYESQGIQGKFYTKSIHILNSEYLIIPQKIYELRSAFYRIITEHMPAETAGVLSAMMLGEKSSLDETVKELYTKSGIGHILAISGLHISLIGAGLFFLLRRYVMPMRASAVTVIFLLILYAELTGFSIATKRAVVMMIVMLVARIIGEAYDGYNALALSALIELLGHPDNLFQAGFLLSYGTALGVLVFMNFWNRAIDKNVYQYFLGNLGMVIMTLPIVLSFYYEINLLSFVVNSLILPFLTFIMVTGFAGGTIGFCIPFAASFLLGSSHYVLKYYQVICEVFCGIPYVVSVTGCPKTWQIILYYALLVLWMLLEEKEEVFGRGFLRCRTLRHLLLVLACILMFLPVHTPFGLKVTMLDVGQGDCSVIQVNGVTMMIDSGSTSVSDVGEYRVVKWLKYHGISKLDYVFVTHADEDHVSALYELVEEKYGIEICRLVLPNVKKTDDNYEKLESLIEKERIVKMKKGDCLKLGDDCVLRCLHPYPDYDWPDANNYSLVLELKYQNFSALFMGDLGLEGEEEIQSRLSRVDLLKVGHHGSKGSSGESFLAKISPKWAVISCGKDNRYGHPHVETLERLSQVGTKVLRTDESGAVSVSVKDGTVRTWGYRMVE